MFHVIASVITKVMLKTSPNAQKCPGKNGINKAIIINDFTNSYNYMSYWQRRLVSLTFICFIKMRMMSRSYSIQMQVLKPKKAGTRVCHMCRAKVRSYIEIRGSY